VNVAVGLAAGYRRFVLRRVVWLAVLAAGVLATVVANVATGPAGLGVLTVLNGLLDPAALSPGTFVILWEVRLPIALMAVCVGGSLGLAGAEMQTVLNNPLASPSTLGVMHAATLGASLVIVFQLDGQGLPANYALPAGAFVGALCSIALIQFLSRALGATVDTVILFGIAMLLVLDALISLMQFVADSDSLQQIVFWTMGSLARATWDKIAIIGVVFAACFPLSMGHAWKLTALRGGDDYAKSFGLAVERLRLIVLLRVSVLTAVSVSFTGVISFIGLVGPHVARLIFGEDHRFYLPGSILAGAFMMSAASIASKLIVPGVLIPDGIVTALVGIPLFLGLILTQRRRRR